jgi:putative sterol carrier protein
MWSRNAVARAHGIVKLADGRDNPHHPVHKRIRPASCRHPQGSGLDSGSLDAALCPDAISVARCTLDGGQANTEVKEDTVVSDPIADFFDDLNRRGHEPLLGKMTGRARFDVVDNSRTRRWLVVIDKGEVSVAQGDDEGGVADCAVRADKALFDRLCRGQENAMAAVLRGAIDCSGDVELLLAIQRVFPGPQHDPAGETGRR